MRTKQTTAWFVLALGVIVTASSIGCSTGRFIGSRQHTRMGSWYPGRGIAGRINEDWGYQGDRGTALASRDRNTPKPPSADAVPRPAGQIASTPGQPMPAEPGQWNGGNYDRTGTPGQYAATGSRSYESTGGRTYDTAGGAPTGGQPQRGFYGNEYQTTGGGGGYADTGSGGYDRYNPSGDRGGYDNRGGYDTGSPYNTGGGYNDTASGGGGYNYERTADLRGSDRFGGGSQGNDGGYNSGGRFDSTGGGSYAPQDSGYDRAGDSQNGGSRFNSGGYQDTHDSGASTGGYNRTSPASYSGDDYGAPPSGQSGGNWSPGSTRSSGDSLSPPATYDGKY